MILKKIVDAFDLHGGESIYLSSDITKLAYYLRKYNGTRLDPAALLQEFQKAVGEYGTLMLPTFCFDFSNNGRYDYCYSKGTSGVLGNVALERCGYKRTLHPMHSFAVWGRDSGLLADMANRHSFGEDSPFGYCKERNVRQVMLGTDYRHSMTFIHYVESVCGVPYRFPKSFSGIYIDASGVGEERVYEYSARYLEIGTEEKFNRMGRILEAEGVARKVEIDGLKDYGGYSVFLGDSYPFIRDDILKNQCRNIYDFSVPRGRLFERYPEK